MLVLNGQYEIREPIGRGGMGVVYRAFDRKQKRPVAVKTIRDVPTPEAIQLFRKECGVLATLNHPSIVNIYDIGEFEENGEKKPFFVMPLLPGNPLDKLIGEFSHRLTVERAVGIVVQACKGLQAAHDKGVIHRDLKPSNIFVMDDDAVVIIDFGVAHMLDTRSTIGQKGSLLYMSPEQLRYEPLSVRSDLFSLGVVCYEAFTRKRPFELSDDQQTIDAILRKIPPPASEVNSAVNSALSRVVHKAMAKRPWSRFSSARELADALQKALRNEALDIFDLERIKPRIQRARKAFDQGDYQFATEILGELEAEGHLDSEISLLHGQIDRTLRQKRIQQLLEHARTRFEEEEYVLAQQKVQEVLDMDPENGPALGLKKTIENTRRERTVEEWLRLAHQHIDNHAYRHASEALHKVLELQPQESRALQLLGEVEASEQEYLRTRDEKARVFDAAQKAWQNGEISTALTKMQTVLDLEHRSPDTTSPEQAAKYESFYKQVHSEHDALKSTYAEASKCLLERDFGKARALCDEYLGKYPSYAPFQMLKFDVEEQERQALSAFIAETDRQVEAEPDLDKRVSILKEAVACYPGEAHFERALRLARQKQELVNGIVAKARFHEERKQFSEALNQWEILRTVYNQQPGLAFEIERVVKRLAQQRSTEAKTRSFQEIDQRLAAGDYKRALQVLNEAKAEFPNDPELASLEQSVLQAKERAAQIEALVSQGKQLCGQQDFEGGLEALRQAYRLDQNNRVTRGVFLGALLERARQLLETDWRLADPLIKEASDLDPNHTQAKGLRELVSDRKRQETVDKCLSRARRLQAEGDLTGAKVELDRGLALHPQDPRLLQFEATLGGELRGVEFQPNRQRDLEEMRRLYEDSQHVTDPSEAGPLSVRVQDIECRYAQDAEFQLMVREVRRRLETLVAPYPAGSGVPPNGVETPRPPQIAELPTPGRAFERLDSMIALARKTVGGVFATCRNTVQTVLDFKPLWPRAAVVVGLLMLVPLAFYIVSHHFYFTGALPPAPPVPNIIVLVESSPPGAMVWIDGKGGGISPLRLKLTATMHRLELKKDGFETLSVPLTARQGMPPLSTFNLRPLPLRLRLVTGELKVVQILWDGQPSSMSQSSGEWVDDSVDPGGHKLEVSSHGVQVTISFEAVAGSMPTTSEVPYAKNLNVVAVCSFPGQARMEANFKPANISVDGGPSVEMQEGGWNFSSLMPGNHTLSWDNLGTTAKVDFEIAHGPELVIFFTPTGTTVKVQLRATPTPEAAGEIPDIVKNSEPDAMREVYRRAYDSYQNNDYAEAIRGALQILKADPNDDEAKRLLDSSVHKESLAIDNAIGKRDLKVARDTINVLLQLLPDDPDVREIEAQVKAEEEAEAAKYRLPPAPKPPLLSLSVTYNTPNKEHAGILTVVAGRLKFDEKAVTGAQAIAIDVPCNAIKEVKERGHRGQRGFRIQMKQGRAYDFLSPEGNSNDVKSACEK